MSDRHRKSVRQRISQTDKTESVRQTDIESVRHRIRQIENQIDRRRECQTDTEKSVRLRISQTDKQNQSDKQT